LLKSMYALRMGELIGRVFSLISTIFMGWLYDRLW
jgi:hypothetical protein